MAGLFAELQRTTQALAAQSEGVFTAGRNMANVNNPAYARQRVVLGDKGVIQTTLGSQSLGIEAVGLRNIRDALLDAQVSRETSSQSSLEAQFDALSKAQLALGQQIDSKDGSSFVDGATNSSSQGIGAAIDNLFNAFSSLAASPRSSAERQVLFQQAQSLVNGMHTVDNRLAAVQNDITDQVTTDVGKVNELLSTISDLNQQIGRFEVGNPGSALDLRDQRQARLEELSQYINFDVENVPDSAGQIRILSRDSADNPVVLLDSAKPFSAVTFDGTNVFGGRPATQLALSSGRIAGGLSARDGTIADLRTSLNSLATQLVTTVNGAYNPGGAYTNFFDAAGTTAATIALDGTLTQDNIRTSTTADPGANDIALAVTGLATTLFSTGSGAQFNGTFGSYYRGIVANIGNATSNAQGLLEDQTTLSNAISARRDSVSGVSLDEEMADLTKYQRAYEASARMMRAIDEMLDTIVNKLG